MDIRLKRAYDPASPSDGYRVLVDRLWPRGVSKQRAKLDEWEKELPPSTKLREWFGTTELDLRSFGGSTSELAVNARV